MKASSGLAEMAVLLAAFVLLWFAPSFAGDYGLQIAFRVLIYLTLAESWNLLAGSAGLVSLGTSCFVGLGAYVAFGLMNAFDVPLPLVLACCAVAGGALAALVSPALFRLRGLYFTVGTLALAELLRLIMVNVSAFGGASGIFLQKDPPPLPGTLSLRSRRRAGRVACDHSLRAHPHFRNLARCPRRRRRRRANGSSPLSGQAWRLRSVERPGSDRRRSASDQARGHRALWNVWSTMVDRRALDGDYRRRRIAARSPWSGRCSWSPSARRSPTIQRRISRSPE